MKEFYPLNHRSNQFFFLSLIYLLIFKVCFSYKLFTINLYHINIYSMNNFEEKLKNIKNEMENVRELYVKGFITKEVYQKETRQLFEMATQYGA